MKAQRKFQHCVFPHPTLIWRANTRLSSLKRLNVPNRLVDNGGYRFWFAQDQQFHSPKGDIYISFDAAQLDSLTSVAAKRIWLGALNDHLQAKYYRAEIAGLHYRIYGHQAGFTLHTRGFTNVADIISKSTS